MSAALIYRSLRQLPVMGRVPCLRLGVMLAVLVSAACAQRTDSQAPAPAAKPAARALADGPVAGEHGSLAWGATPSRSACPDQRGFLWVHAQDGPSCIRYFGSTDLDDAAIAIVQLSGDRDAVMHLPPPRIPGNTAALRLEDAQRNRNRAGIPWVFMARPGTYGSSGDHRLRNASAEFEALASAIDALERRHRVQRIVLVGHGGGATAAAALLTMGRNDIECAVLTSGAYGRNERNRLPGVPHDAASAAIERPDAYMPMDHVQGVARDPARRIVIIGNRDDRTTPFGLQEKFGNAVAQAGHHVVVMTHAAEAPVYHDLKDRIGPRMASLCAREATSWNQKVGTSSQ